MAVAEREDTRLEREERTRENPERNADENRSTIDARTLEERRSGRCLAVREILDRIGYGGATPQFINILFWIAQQANPYILFIIGLLNGFKSVASVFWSEILIEYAKLHRVSKNMIAAAGIIYGFSFLFMAFGLLLHNMWLFAVSFLIGSIGVVAYGDLYQRFARDTIRKERTGGFLRAIAHWGIIITALSLLFSGFLLDRFPMSGVPWHMTLLGKTLSMSLYGYLFMFEMTAFAFILSGYVTSLITDRREVRTYPFWQFIKEYMRILSYKIKTIWANTYVKFMLVAALLAGILQLSITAYSGIAIYQRLAEVYQYPFLPLAVIYTIAIIASFTGPFFTERIHRSTGLTPTLVFGTLLTAILPLVLYYKGNVVTIVLALCLYVIGAAIVGFGQGLLAKKLMDDETRQNYFQVQSILIAVPYIILIPIMAWVANALPLGTLFMITAIGLALVVMPIYFFLVVISEKVKL
jgi:MFS family permease